MSYDEAAQRLLYLAREAVRRGVTGIALKDETRVIEDGTRALHRSGDGEAVISDRPCC
jgi:hypothetical protein